MGRVLKHQEYRLCLKKTDECQKELDQVPEYDSESNDEELNGRTRREKKEQGGELSVS